MSNSKEIHNSVYYRMIKTTEVISGNAVVMYGLEAFSDSGFISISALSTDKNRISSMVDRLNQCEMELSQLQGIIDRFLEGE